MKHSLGAAAIAAALVTGAAFFSASASAQANPQAQSSAADNAAPSSEKTFGFIKDSSQGIYAGDILARVRAIGILPDSHASGSVLPTLGVSVNNAIVPELDFTYMILDNVGVELILGMSRHQLTSNLGHLGGVNVLPPTLLLQYHFNHAGKVRPYVGAGINYTRFWNSNLNAGGTPISIKNHSVGPALQAGVDIQMTKTMFFNIDIKKIWMKTDTSLAGTDLGTLHIDPLIVGVGVGVKF
ncbi:OmpW/AlkL family protein [Pandoraea fibrosis]|uniref:OmpW family protein n=1 Tax=Pandoraea fibrosis TaxID=1891094 RepID=A0A5E4TQQ2_9BURK|nr:OmpW family outer membrane protein [Pandoraea fibrosis]QHE90954.1 outer membrane beta-barrel protein [Pandoraea fibrosis]QHF11785.1 outer membrane beta-barrel protein [Pandoraea fibrosis]VVD88938.1 OmpW family protein [Pandoraea fibrosis]